MKKFNVKCESCGTKARVKSLHKDTKCRECGGTLVRVK